MYRKLFFVLGFAIAAFALPQVLEHHARAELMQLAWCSSSGNAAPQSGLFAFHCIACPILVAGVSAMLISLVMPVRRFGLRVKEARL
ncbi:hypothetical protein [Henriciella sp.]|uniref:hypothetical protein n=1 Tax=Henriciella sp. TaxID=1968823 RepID=UPI002627E5D7|nr:hypothetical protein [Henriciella sp.]